jgi:hypothetical protein
MLTNHHLDHSNQDLITSKLFLIQYGKGMESRVTMLPTSLAKELKFH